MKEVYFYMMVGLQGAGKTYIANKNSNENIIHISSDSIRKKLYGSELDQEYNKEVFKVMNQRTKEYLKNGFSVIYDATNINSKRRRTFLNELNGIDCKKVCLYIPSTPSGSFIRQLERERVVDVEIIDKTYKNLQIPMYHEGWDNIVILKRPSYLLGRINLKDIKTYYDYERFLLEYNLKECVDFAQDNQYHTLSVSRHMYYAFNNIKNNTNNESLQLATMLHDIGKPYCKNFKEGSKYANFYGHENVGAQMVVELLLEMKYSDDEIIKIATYVQLHMRLLNSSEKGREKLKRLLGADLYLDLILLKNADTSAK